MRRPHLVVVLCLVALAGQGVRATPSSPTLHGTLEVEARGLLAAPLGITSLFLTSAALPLVVARITHPGQKIPRVDLVGGIRIRNSYHVTMRFTLTRGDGGYHLTAATLDYALRDDSRVPEDGGVSMKDHMWATGRIRYAHGRWIGAPAGWHVKGGPRLDLRFDPAGGFDLRGEIVHPLRIEGHSALEAPMATLILDGKRDHLEVHSQLPFQVGKVPANAGPMAQLMKQAAAMATHPTSIPAPEPFTWPVHLTGKATGDRFRVVRTLPLPQGTQVVTWLEVGP